MPKGHQSLKGKLLLDGGRLGGSFFHRTVVLICQHSPQGAFGLVLNRPSENRLADVFNVALPPRLQDETLFGGGPVEPAALSYLHHAPYLPDANVLEGLSVGHDLNQLLELGNSWAPGQQLRVFAGYAGWSPGQLDDELRRDSWLTHPATTELVFHTPPENLWRHVLRQRADWAERLLADQPDDLSFN